MSTDSVSVACCHKLLSRHHESTQHDSGLSCNHDWHPRVRRWLNPGSLKYKDKVEMFTYQSDPTIMMDMIQKPTSLNRVLIMNGAIINGERRGTCNFKVGPNVFQNVYSWMSKDPDARMQKKESLRGMEWNGLEALKPFDGRSEMLSRHYSFTVSWMQLSRREYNLWTSLSHSQFERCLSDQVVHADAFVDTVVLQNYYLLFAVTVVMLSASIIALLFEFVCKWSFQSNVW